MKKIFSLLSIFMMLSLVSCEVEEVGPKGEGQEYSSYFSFRLNGEDRVTNNVKMNWVDNSSLEILADIRDKYSNYDKIHVRLVISNLKKGDYPWVENMASSEPCSTMSVTMPNGNTYSSDKTPFDVNNSSYALIDMINTENAYFSGSFNYTLYFKDTNTNQMKSINLDEGRFNYVSYEVD